MQKAPSNVPAKYYLDLYLVPESGLFGPWAVDRMTSNIHDVLTHIFAYRPN